MILTWDRYKDSYLINSYQDPGEVEGLVPNSLTISKNVTRCRHGPRVLLGIMTTLDSEKEIQRRHTIRETYLSYYRDDNKNKTLMSKRHRICGLHELLDQDGPNHELLLQECQLAFAFIAGANKTGPTKRVKYSVEEPMTILSNSSEPDIVLLNIKENMNNGKSQTYHKFGGMISEEYICFDYIAKTDSDTLLYIDRLLDEGINTLPTYPDNCRSYGGQDVHAGRGIQDKEGVVYFTGAFYFFSPDIARFLYEPSGRQSLSFIIVSMTTKTISC